jgi:UDP-N-acetylglucosamine 4,6-dehydratase (inverting)
MSDNIFSGASVLITGGTGSFGNHFTRYLLGTHNPRRVIVFSRDELKQYEMAQRFVEERRVRFFIGDVRDMERLELATRDVDVVVHAAALKQVPACEYNPFEAVNTNIIGTKNVIAACLRNGVKRAMLISTDKAVNPVNLYGATKACAEKLFVQANAYSGRTPIRFAAVRYGNVVGSRGSVVPLFRRQRESGVLTITDTNMTRFWITLDQAVAFVGNCIQEMTGGEVFVPKIPSCRITELAAAIAPGCETKIIGIRPGEKVHELLLTVDESRHSVDAGDYFVIEPEHDFWVTEQHGTPLPNGFIFASNTNDQWLTTDQLRAIVDRV